MQHEEHLCHACRRPLNASTPDPRKEVLQRKLRREVHARREVASAFDHFFTVSDPLAASSYGAKHEGKTEEEADQRARKAFTLTAAFLAGVVLAVASIA
jgi:hypothetical protein